MTPTTTTTTRQPAAAEQDRSPPNVSRALTRASSAGAPDALAFPSVSRAPRRPVPRFGCAPCLGSSNPPRQQAVGISILF